jgi:hypothetical protein
MLTQERLKELLDYNPDTGVFVWKVAHHKNAIPKTKAGKIYRNGYVLIFLDGRSYVGQQLAWLYVHGQWPDRRLTHINCVREDNRITNLRQKGKTPQLEEI